MTYDAAIARRIPITLKRTARNERRRCLGALWLSSEAHEGARRRSFVTPSQDTLQVSRHAAAPTDMTNSTPKMCLHGVRMAPFAADVPHHPQRKKSFMMASYW